LKSVFIIAIVAVAMIGGMVPGVFAERGLECPNYSPTSNYEMVFECNKKINVNIGVLESMFEDINFVSGLFPQAELYNIEQNDNGGTALMGIDLKITELKSEIKFLKRSSDYQINFETGKLAGSQMIIATSTTSDFNGTSDMGTDVSLTFKMKKKMCIEIIMFKQCAQPNQIMDALDKGLTLLEPQGVKIQKENPEFIVLPTTKTDVIPNEISPPKTSVINKETFEKLKKDPEVIKAAKEFDSQPEKKYFPEEKKSLPPIPVTNCSNISPNHDFEKWLDCKGVIVQTDQSVYWHGNEIQITTIVNYKNAQPLLLEFYNVSNELVFSEKVYPASNGMFQKSYEIGTVIPAVFHDEFNIYATYDGNKDSVNVSLANFGNTIELDQKVYAPTDRVLISVVSPDHNFDDNSRDVIGNDDFSTITISTDRGYLDNYELVETGKNTGVFVGEISLVYDKPVKGTGPNKGELSNYSEDELQIWMKVNFENTFATALIRANIGEVSWLDNDENYMDLTNSYMPGDTATVQIIDPDLNKNSDSREVIFSKIYSDSDSNGKTIRLTEMDEIPGIFRGLVSFSTTPSNERLTVSSGDTIRLEFEDTIIPQPYHKTDTLIISSETKIFGTKSTTSLSPENNFVEKIPVIKSNQLKITTDNDFYDVGDTVKITGKSVSDISNINIKIIDPNGDMIKMLQAKVSGNNLFQTTFEIQKQFFPLAGGYEIIAWQSSESQDMDSIPITIGIKGLTKSSTYSDVNTIIEITPTAVDCKNTNSCYSPMALSIDVGDTVKWNVLSGSEFTVTNGSPSDDYVGDEFDSGNLMSGDSFSHTFITSGTFDYFDKNHPWMSGTIHVNESNTVVSPIPKPIIDNTITTTDTIECGSGTELVNGVCEIIPKPVVEPVVATQESEDDGGCLIATATYGSEMSQQVQQLRELRDNQLLQTESGKSFMGTFNDIYYSFSPTIADMEREHPMFKEAVKIAITPMISSLSLMENANSESEVLSIGILVIMLNLGMYLAVPAIVVIGIRKIK
jgi:plastocyanin